MKDFVVVVGGWSDIGMVTCCRCEKNRVFFFKILLAVRRAGIDSLSCDFRIG